MAVKQDTRQKLLFAIDDFPTIEAGKCCNRCKVFKSPSEFYTVKRKSGEGRSLSSICKRCDNGRRVGTLRKAKLPGHVSQEEIWRIARAEKEKLRKIERRICEIPQPTALELVALREFQKLANRSRRKMRDCWTRKADSVLSGINARKSRNIKIDKRLKGIVTTWETASEKQFSLLRSRVLSRSANEWHRKATHAASVHHYRTERNVISKQDSDFR